MADNKNPSQTGASFDQYVDYPHSTAPSIPDHISLLSAQASGNFSQDVHDALKHQLGISGHKFTEVNDNKAFMVEHDGDAHSKQKIQDIAKKFNQAQVLHSSKGNNELVNMNGDAPSIGQGMIHGPFLKENYTKLPSGHKVKFRVSSPPKMEKFDAPQEVKDAYAVISKSEGETGPLLDGGKYRRFYLQRDADDTGMSGTGRVAEGCEFSNGWVGLNWLTRTGSVAFYPNIEAVEKVHGHGGKTKIVFDDAPGLKKAFTHGDGETQTPMTSLTGTTGPVPDALMQWGAEKLAPLPTDAIESLELDGHIIKVRKHLEDLYSGWIEKEGNKIHQFEKVTMPEVLAQVRSKLELYGKEGQVVAEQQASENKPVEAVAPEVPKENEMKEELEQIKDLEDIDRKIKDLSDKIRDFKQKELAEVAEHVAVVPGSELVAGIENPEKECEACERPSDKCVCYTGMSTPKIEFDGKRLTIFFKSEWGDDDRENFVGDLKRRAGLVLEKRRLMQAEVVLKAIRRKLNDKH